MAFVILIGVSGLLSLALLQRCRRRLSHACGVGFVSYLALQVADAWYHGFVDPFFLIALPASCGVGMAVYYLVFWVSGCFRGGGVGR